MIYNEGDKASDVADDCMRASDVESNGTAYALQRVECGGSLCGIGSACVRGGPPQSYLELNFVNRTPQWRPMLCQNQSAHLTMDSETLRHDCLASRPALGEGTLGSTQARRQRPTATPAHRIGCLARPGCDRTAESRRRLQLSCSGNADTSAFRRDRVRSTMILSPPLPRVSGERARP